jgi:hypothetical protein
MQTGANGTDFLKLNHQVLPLEKNAERGWFMDAEFGVSRQTNLSGEKARSVANP